MKFSIKARLWLLAGSSMAAMVLFAGLATYNTRVSAEGLKLIVNGTSLVEAAGSTDMFHDALRNDVLRAQLAAGGRDFTAVSVASRDAAESGANLMQGLQRLAAADLSTATHARIEQALPLARGYVELAAAAIAAMQDEAGGAVARERFEARFKELETVLDSVTQSVVAEVDQRAATVQEAQSAMGLHAVLAAAVGCLLAAGLGTLLVRSVMTPVNRLIGATRALNAGDSDLSRRLPEADAELGLLSNEFNAFIGKLTGLVGTIQQASLDIRSDSAQIASGNADLQRRTEHSAGSLQQTAASAEEINATIQQTAEAARQACLLVQQSTEVAAQGGQAVGRVVTTMDEISESSRRIADIVSVIEGIAFQTNVLALNAAVEAARAGNQGRGFAVVATEVRTLALRCSDAAQEIGSLIQNSVEKVGLGAERVREAGRSMDAIVDSVQRVAAMMSEITSAATEQSAGMQQVTEAVAQLDQVTQQNAALVEQSTAAAMSLRERAEHLASAVSGYRLPPANA